MNHKDSTFTFRIAAKTLSDWKRRARQDGRSLASWITSIVERHKKQQQEKDHGQEDV